jgi:hypothetical protein
MPETVETVSVRFLVRDAPWGAGDVAELPAPAAAKAVRYGVAEYVDRAPADPGEEVDRG